MNIDVFYAGELEINTTSKIFKNDIIVIELEVEFYGYNDIRI